MHQIIIVGRLSTNKYKMLDIHKRVYSPDGISPTIHTFAGGGTEIKVMSSEFLKPCEDGYEVRENTAKGYAVAKLGDSVNISQPNSKTRRGRVGKGVANTLLCNDQMAVLTDDRELVIAASRGRNSRDPSDRIKGVTTKQRLEVNKRGVVNTLTSVQKDNLLIENPSTNYRIRKLTPLECYRLMGFTDSEFISAALLIPESDTQKYISASELSGLSLTKIVQQEQVKDKKSTTSNRQLYRQAGNSIVVDVMEHLMKAVIKAVPCIL